jgi:SH3 domain protein
VSRRATLAVAVPAMLIAAGGWAATAYVTDELVLNVYSEINQQGQRLTTLHSGASVESLATSGDFTQVRLPDGVTGWVKSSYLTNQVPATVRLKELEEELERNRATTPALAAAASRTEVERLERELAAKQTELEAARAARQEPSGAVPAPPSPQSSHGGVAAGAAFCAAAGGFWLGYVTLARRVRRKFGGLRVY